MLAGFIGGYFGNSLTTPRYTETSLVATPISTATSVAWNAATVANACMNTVVEITTESVQTSDRMMQYVSEGAGSGVIISTDGYIATNCHVISGASKITVTLKNGKEYAAKLRGSDEKSDLALLKIDASGLKAASYGSSDGLNVGEPVVAIGNPLGELGGTVTDGIVSALGRQINIDGENMTLLQTNASINPGNSGGGLFDSTGKLIGIVNAKSSGSGIEGLGFAIPIDTAKGILSQLKSQGYVSGRIETGFVMANISGFNLFRYGLRTPGVYVTEVGAATSAAKAGLKSGDMLLTINGESVKSADGAKELIDKCEVGDVMVVTVMRSGAEVTLKITLAEARPTGASV